MAAFLELRIDEPWLIGVVGALSVGLIVVLLIRRRVEGWPLWAAPSMTVGASAAIAFALYARKTNLFGMPLPWQSVVWGAGGSAAVGLAVANLVGAPWRRRAVAVLATPIFLIEATLGINAYYGLTPTVASFFHLQTWIVSD